MLQILCYNKRNEKLMNMSLKYHDNFSNLERMSGLLAFYPPPKLAEGVLGGEEVRKLKKNGFKG